MRWQWEQKNKPGQTTVFSKEFMASFHAHALLMYRQDLSVRSRSASKHAQTRHTNLLTAIFIRQLRSISFRWTLLYRSHVDSTRVRVKKQKQTNKAKQNKKKKRLKHVGVPTIFVWSYVSRRRILSPGDRLISTWPRSWLDGRNQGYQIKNSERVKKNSL